MNHFLSQQTATQALRAQWHWPNFTIAELACRCEGRFCQGAYWHDPLFLDALQALRDQIGRALIVTSGHRCPLWNATVGGAPLSQHKTLAVDLSLAGQDRWQLMERARRVGFTGFGLGRTFLHLDRRTQSAEWKYPGSEHVWMRS